MKKNVMFLIHDLNNGGAERSIVNLANKISEYHNVIMVTGNCENPDYVCNAKIIEVKELCMKKRKMIAIMKLRKLKKKHHIDVTISYLIACNFINVMSKYKDKIIISVRNYLSISHKQFRLYLFHKIALKLCDLVVCCSESVKKDQLSYYHSNSNKTVVIPNFCDFKNLNQEKNIKLSKKEKEILNDEVLITMGRIIPHKGHQHIIKAMSLVVEERPNARLLIFGRGHFKETLEELVQKYHLDKNVFFMGFDSNPYRFLKHAKAFILSSDYEGMPNVLLEAMACGVPVIATDSPGGSKELLMEHVDWDEKTTSLTKTDYGILVPTFMNEHNIDEITKNDMILKDAILDILSNPDSYQYYHKQSLERAKKYDVDLIIKKWLEII